MPSAKVNGVEIEFAVRGTGEPVLLIPTGPVADSFGPVFEDDALAGSYRLIGFHRRGQAGSTHSPPPVSFAEQAADAAGLLEHLGVGRAHVAGHSTGGVLALQLAVDRPDLVHTLSLLEPTLMAVPSAPEFMRAAAPIFADYASGDREKAMTGFISAVSGLDWPECARLIETGAPGGVAQAIKDADTFFGIDLPAHDSWIFGPDQAAAVTAPVLSVVGSRSSQIFIEGRQFLRSCFPKLEECTIPGAGHLLHLEKPSEVIRCLGEFFGRHPMD